MTYRVDTSLLLQLRDAAKVERDELTRFRMRQTADALSQAIAAFKDSSNCNTLTEVNAQWARGIRVLGFATAVDPNGGGAKMRNAA